MNLNLFLDLSDDEAICLDPDSVAFGFKFLVDYETLVGIATQDELLKALTTFLRQLLHRKLSSEQLDKVVSGLAGGSDGYLKYWGYEQLARAIEHAVFNPPAVLIAQQDNEINEEI